jgi:hypothetical protein
MASPASSGMIAAGLALVLSVAAPFTASVAVAGERPYMSFNGEPRVPDCSDASVTGAVAGRVARADPAYGHGLTITGMERVVETSYQVDRPSPYARRFCEARAHMSDGRTRRVYYAISEHAGFLGIGWGLEACVAGVDPWRVYDARCRTARPW